MSPEIFFHPAASGARLHVHYPVGNGEARGVVLCVPPFAEEMNKSRRMLTLQARQLAAAGYATLLVDLFGTGDSSGDFGEATWMQWRDDLVRATTWLRERYTAPLWLWGVRTGALLASEMAAALQPTGLLLWSPVRSGKQYLQQFLRLRAASAMMTGDAKGVVAELRHALERGHPVEVAGYTLSAALAEALNDAELTPWNGLQKLIWFELSSQTPAQFTPAVSADLQRWRDTGQNVHAEALTGAAFWQTADIEIVPELFAATVKAVTSSGNV